MEDKVLNEMIRFFEEKLEETKKDTSEEFDVCRKTTIDAWAIQNVLWALEKEQNRR